MALKTAQPGCLRALATDPEHSICIALFVSNWQPYLVFPDAQPSSALHFAPLQSPAQSPITEQSGGNANALICISHKLDVPWMHPE